jgi:endo-1,4-beta-xylanase
MNDAHYLALLTRHFSLVVPEYGQYMSHLRSAADDWNFARSDEIVEFAMRHGLRVRGHSLVWGLPIGSSNPFGGWTPTPSWVHGAALSREHAIEVLLRHIETVMARYRGRLNEWIVVNEALGSRTIDGLSLSPTIWLDRIGPDYIKLAFTHARKVAPDAVLILNDYGADYLGQDRATGAGSRVDNYFNLVVRLLDEGTPIDGVGFQFHLEVGRDKPSVAQITDNLARYHALGLSTHITELDARIRKPVTDAKLNEQARLYETVFRAALESEETKDLVMWGFTDRYSWITAGETFPNHDAGVLMDQNFGTRPAFHAVKNALGNAPSRSGAD